MTATAGVTGQQAEAAAARHLRRRGLRLLERNFRCRLGEIDLVMLDGTTVVFVEVKYRKTSHYGSAAEQVSYAKQQKLRRTALAYLSERTQYAHAACRFDVVGISSDAGRLSFDWIKDALATH